MHTVRFASKAFSSRSLRLLAFASLLLSFVTLEVQLHGQTPKPRIAGAVRDGERTSLRGSKSPRALAEDDAGELSPGTRISGVTMTFAPSAAQQADLDALIAAQGNPASPLYHQWLTPEQFGARFGMADEDLAKVQNWLRGQGFTIDSVARGRNSITFSGTAGQVSSAFSAPLHTYRGGAATPAGTANYAPSTDLSLPTAFAATVAGVNNLSTFRPKPHLRQLTPEALGPKYTSSQTGNHFLTPKDIATIYDVTPAYNAGYTGVGQTIAIAGQSSVLNTDIASFQTAVGNPVVAPTFVLVPNSGTPTVYTADEAESDLDLEYSGALAPGATLLFVYTGNNANYGVFNAMNYAIAERIAPIISISYGSCEGAYTATSYAAQNAMLAQAATQGQTVIAASGDAGSTDCYNPGSTLPALTQQGLYVDFPASSAYVTGMGGTEFSAASVDKGNTTYWSGASGNDVISSALSYIPEQVWNDDTTSSGAISISASGGGTSLYTARPTWQTGVIGIPTGSFRLVPDVSLTSSPVNGGYLYCSSDSSTSVSGSCSNGFRDVNNSTLTVAGGTSFAAPVFAGMVALINQSRNSTGQGLINPTLYALAGNATTYASAFHDITTGTNACTSGVSGCSAAGAGSYAAGVGYDQATGLGSVDLYKLLTAWPSGSATPPAASTLTLSAATTTPAASVADAVTLRVAATSGASAPPPTGTVSLVVDGAAATQLTLASGAAAYTFTAAIAGVHTLVATYSGDAIYAASTATLVLTVGTPPSTAAFSISAPSISVTAGNSATSTVRVTSSNGYAGSVSWTLAARTSVANFCYNIPNVAVATGSTQTTTLTVYTSSASCSSTTIKTLPAGLIASLTPDAGMLRTGSYGAGRSAETGRSGETGRRGRTGLALAGVFGLALYGMRSRKLRPLLSLTLLAGIGLGLSGCSSSGTSSTISSVNAKTATGTYSFTLTGTDTVTSAVISSTTFAVTVN